jgi:heme A synthase
MLTTLRGSTLWAVTAIVLAVIGAATYLSSQGILSGSDWLVLGTAVLASVGIVTGAHVAAQTAITAVNTPTPGATLPPPAAPTATPGPVPDATTGLDIPPPLPI